MAEKRFKDKVVLVTGAASGIGKATALRFAEEGAALMICDVNESGLKDVAALLDAQGTENIFFAFDVSDPEACRASVEQTVDTYGKLDVLCNIAGYARLKHLTEITDTDWQKMLGVNLSGVFYMSRDAMPHLIKTKGSIVNMASTASVVGQAYNAMYCATKGGVMMLSKSMAVEFAKQGIRVNAICPGAVNTPLTEQFSIPDGADMDLIGKLFPLIDAAQPEEIAAAVIYLASSDARFITGEALVIDGAQTAC